MIRRLLSTWHFVRAGDCLSTGDYASAFHAMKRAKTLAGTSYNKTSLFEINLRMAQAAKMCGHSEIAIEEIRRAKDKILKSNSINEHEREYLIIFCKLLEAECSGDSSAAARDLEAIRRLLDGDLVAKRFKKSYPIMTQPRGDPGQ